MLVSRIGFIMQPPWDTGIITYTCSSLFAIKCNMNLKIKEFDEITFNFHWHDLDILADPR